jgi:hypothetical protein
VSLQHHFKQRDRRSATTSRCSSASSFWKSCRHGIVLYDGEVTVGFGEGMFAVPIAELWR